MLNDFNLVMGFAFLNLNCNLARVMSSYVIVFSFFFIYSVYQNPLKRQCRDRYSSLIRQRRRIFVSV